MLSSLYIWKMLAGVSFFLLGMNFIEESLHTIAGRSFKLFLKRQTSSNTKAIITGTFLTGILQSSSVVNTMVLAFVGTGVLTMQRAIAVILGDNLGTTVDSWFFAVAGFGFNIQNFAFAFTGIPGIAMILFNKNKKPYQWSRFLLGVGLLFLGLDFIKTGMMDLVVKIDLNDFKNKSAVFFLLTGLVITSLIQSSSATMVILLSALYAHAISLYDATAVVLGAEIGTTLKFLLASVKGIAPKKRVATGNFLFNVITSIIMLFFLEPINYFITSVIGIKSTLVGLVFFQSFINLAGIVLFFPFLNLFAKLLEKLFRKNDADTFFIHKVSSENTDLAIDAFEKESKYFLYYVIQYSLDIFKIKWPHNTPPDLSEKFTALALTEKYNFIKHLHGELLAYYIELQNNSSDKQEAIRLDKIISTVRNSMYAAKSMKDALPDAAMLRNSSNDLKYNFYLKACEKIESFYTHVLQVTEEKPVYLQALIGLFKEVHDGYADSLKGLYNQNFQKKMDEIEISSIINFNRQIYTSFKSIGLSVKDYFLTEKEAEYFDALPGFIH